MPTRDRISSAPSTSGRHYLTLGAAIVALLIGAYVIMGTPGLFTQVANAPGVDQLQADMSQPGTIANGAAPAKAGR